MPGFTDESELAHIRTFIVRAIYIDGSEADLASVALSTRAEARQMLDDVYLQWRSPTELDDEWALSQQYNAAVVALELWDPAEPGVIARYEIEPGSGAFG